MPLQCETGFELRGMTRKPSAEGEGVENGETLLLRFADGQTLTVVVTKATDCDGQKLIGFNSPLIVAIEKVEA